VRRINGVKGCGNLIQLKPQARAAEIKKKIQDAFKRNVRADCKHLLAKGGTRGCQLGPWLKIPECPKGEGSDAY
jgi:hypothetical protein